jgi:hypothetical protein
VSLIFFLDLFINLFMSPNLFGWVPYLSKSLQDFSRDFSELRAIFHGLKGNFRFSEIILFAEALDALVSEVQPLSRATARSFLHPSPKFCIYSLRSGELSDELFWPNRRVPMLATTTKRQPSSFSTPWYIRLRESIAVSSSFHLFLFLSGEVSPWLTGAPPSPR